MSKSSKKIKDLIEQEIKNLEDGHEEKDEEYQPRFIESPTKLDAEERVIDELLASVPKNAGYYLKLSKEIRPNEFELKLRIDNYDAWSDLEWEITNLVRAYSLKSPQKWGSGHYRVIIWREGGLRGPKFKPIDFYIDAQEIENSNMSTNMNISNLSGDVQEKIKEQFASFNELIKTLQVLNPTASPTDIQGKIFEAFKSGLDAKAQSMQIDAAKDVANQSQMTSILLELVRQNANKPIAPSIDQTILTQLIQTLQNNNNNRPIEKDPLDLIIKLKDAGLIPQPQAPVDSVTKAFEIINMILPMIQGLSGGAGESTISTIIKTVGPQISKIVGDVTGSINKAIDAKLTVQKPLTNNAVLPTHTEIFEKTHVSSKNDNVGDANMRFFNDLKRAIQNNDIDFFPVLEDALLSVTSEENYNKVLSGETPIETVALQVARFGGEYFNSPQALAYYNKYVEWTRERKLTEHVVKCSKCQADNIYETKEYFNILTDEDEDASCINCHASLLINKV